MKIYAIFANDNIKGTTYKIFNKSIELLKEKGHNIDELLLYDKETELPFFKHDRAYMESFPFYLQNKERFLDADTLLLVFPLFWYSVPGILKTWIDMINGWAYTYQGGIHAKPNHKVKRVIVIYSCMQSKKFLDEKLQNPVEKQLSETFTFIGVPETVCYCIDEVNAITDEKLNTHFENIKKLL